ncbi:MAG: hypothetical protein H6745_04395 [Deltaproteobacteria bacterium]|nr:hypothetical protein [Deltaproteobacteria bacterium]
MSAALEQALLGASGPARRPASRRRRVLMGFVFACWSLAAVVLGGTLMAKHLVTLPAPKTDDGALLAAVDGLRAPGERGRWMAVHFLYSECNCSKRVIDHMVEVPRRPDVIDKVILVGDGSRLAPRLRAHGIAVEAIAPADMTARFHVDAAPLLVVAAPDGHIAYLGGYTRRKQGPDIQDLAIFGELVGGAPAPEALPLYGCATAKSLQDMLDPFGIL